MSREAILLIIYAVAALLILGVFAVAFVVAFQKRKNKFLMERFEAEGIDFAFPSQTISLETSDSA